MADLSVEIKGLRLKNPVMTASGTFGYGPEFADFVPLEGIGGIIVKGTTLKPRQGNDYPRMVETASGMLNCVGLQNKGVDYFCEHIYPEIKDIDTNFIVNVSGSSPEDYAECAARIAELEQQVSDLTAKAKTDDEIKILEAVAKAGGIDKLIRAAASKYTPAGRTTTIGKKTDTKKVSKIGQKLEKIREERKGGNK